MAGTTGTWGSLREESGGGVVGNSRVELVEGTEYSEGDLLLALRGISLFQLCAPGDGAPSDDGVFCTESERGLLPIAWNAKERPRL